MAKGGDSYYAGMRSESFQRWRVLLEVEVMAPDEATAKEKAIGYTIFRGDNRLSNVLMITPTTASKGGS